MLLISKGCENISLNIGAGNTIAFAGNFLLSFGEFKYVEQRSAMVGAFRLAVTNRNKKLLLSEAWKHYWAVLFPRGVDWQTDLETEVRKRLYFPGEVSDFLSEKSSEHRAPEWADRLVIGFKGNLVTIEFGEEEFGKFPLFSDGLLPVLNNWTDKNPLEKAEELSDLTIQERVDCRDFMIAAVRDCGAAVRARLLQSLKNTEKPIFEIFCRPKGDVFAEVRKLPTSGLSEVVDVCISSNELTDRLRLRTGTPTKSKSACHTKRSIAASMCRPVAF